MSAAADYLNRNPAAAVQIIGGEPGSTARTAKEAPRFIPITLPAAIVALPRAAPGKVRRSEAIREVGEDGQTEWACCWIQNNSGLPQGPAELSPGRLLI